MTAPRKTNDVSHGELHAVFFSGSSPSVNLTRKLHNLDSLLQRALNLKSHAPKVEASRSQDERNACFNRRLFQNGIADLFDVTHSVRPQQCDERDNKRSERDHDRRFGEIARVFRDLHRLPSLDLSVEKSLVRGSLGHFASQSRVGHTKQDEKRNPDQRREDHADRYAHSLGDRAVFSQQADHPDRNHDRTCQQSQSSADSGGHCSWLSSHCHSCVRLQANPLILRLQQGRAFIQAIKFLMRASSSIDICKSGFVFIVALGGGVPCQLPNRAHCRPRGLGEREEQLFSESRQARRPLDLVLRASRSGRISRRHIWRSAPVAASELQISTSAAIESPLTRCSWLCWMNCARASGLDCRSESNQRQIRPAGWPKAPVRLRSIPADRVASRGGRRAALHAWGEPHATVHGRAA